MILGEKASAFDGESKQTLYNFGDSYYYVIRRFNNIVSPLQVDAILGEPFFTSALFPWHHLYFWYAASSAARISRPEVKVLPRGATLKALAGQFWKQHCINQKTSRPVTKQLLTEDYNSYCSIPVLKVSISPVQPMMAGKFSL